MGTAVIAAHLSGSRRSGNTLMMQFCIFLCHTGKLFSKLFSSPLPKFDGVQFSLCPPTLRLDVVLVALSTCPTRVPLCRGLRHGGVPRPTGRPTPQSVHALRSLPLQSAPILHCKEESYQVSSVNLLVRSEISVPSKEPTGSATMKLFIATRHESFKSHHDARGPPKQLKSGSN